MLPVSKSGPAFYKEGFAAQDVAGYADAAEGVRMVLDAFDELPPGVVALFRGAGIYVSTREGSSAVP